MRTDTREALAALLYASEEILLFEDNSLPEIERFEAAKEAARTALATQPAQPSAQAVKEWRPGLEPDDTDKRAVRFIGTDPLDIAANATLPMVAESWRFGFRLNDDMTLTFTLMDDGPLVAYAAVSQPSAQGEPIRQLHSFSSIDCEKLIAATVPGGSVCDPQEVADNIRRYLNAWPDGDEPAQPSAQGEAVAWRPGDPLYDDAYVRGVAVGFSADDSRRTTLLRIADRIEARASATAAPAQAVPLTDYEIAQMMNARSLQDGNDDSPWWLLFARDVERRASGIKAAP